MNKTRVGIDVDGVLRGFVEQIIKLADEEGIQVKEPSNYEFLGQYIGDETIRSKIWGSKEWLERVFVDAPVLEKARSGYELFCSDPQFEVYIVSAQREGTEKYTTQWLNKNRFKSHVSNIYTHNKLEAPCQILIDDKPSNVQEYNDNARMGVMIDASYNRHVRTPYKVKNLIEAYNLLK